MQKIDERRGIAGGRNRIAQQEIRKSVARIPRVKGERSEPRAARRTRAVTDDGGIARDADECAVDARLERMVSLDSFYL